MPKRIRRKRTKGWRMPEGAVYVGRPSKWGNPFLLQGNWICWAAIAWGFRADAPGRRAAAVAMFRAWLTTEVEEGPLAKDNAGGVFEYSDGSRQTVGEHFRGLAAALSPIYADEVKLPPRPLLDELRGKDLACWCPLDQPCHADVLLEIANA